ncbi:MAG: ABC transporter substrate-binding protein [Deltaproteobacteria bacterium]|nr:ABC transporter substrate-binding protein [Deltaproteobacteria bacterium]
MLFTIFLLLFSTPSKVEVKSLSPSWIKILKASYSYALDEEKSGDEYLKEAMGGTPREVSNATAYTLFHKMCSNPDFSDASKMLNIKGINPVTLLKVYSSVFYNTTMEKDVFSSNLKNVLDIRDTKKCAPNAFVRFLENLYPAEMKNPTGKYIREWINTHITVIDKNHKFKGIVKALMLLHKRFDSVMGKTKWLAADELEMKNLSNNSCCRDLLTENPYPWRISAMIPLSGPWSILGKQIMYSILIAKKLFPALEIIVHDTASSPSKTLRIFKEKVMISDRSFMVIAPPRKDTFTALMKENVSGLSFFYPLSSFDTKLQTGKTVFYGEPEKSTRVENLISAARFRGAKTFGVLHPDNSFGKEFAKEFEESLRKKKLKQLFSKKYSISSIPSKLKIPDVDAIFIPDKATRVETIAKVLAASGHFPGPLKNSKGMLILATAEALDQGVFDRSGRYLTGGLFSPVFSSAAINNMDTVFTEEMTALGVKNILSIAIETFNFLQNIHFMLKQGKFTHESVINGLKSISAGPGLGNYYDPSGKIISSCRTYYYDGKNLKLVSN